MMPGKSLEQIICVEAHMEKAHMEQVLLTSLLTSLVMSYWIYRNQYSNPSWFATNRNHNAAFGAHASLNVTSEIWRLPS